MKMLLCEPVAEFCLIDRLSFEQVCCDHTVPQTPLSGKRIIIGLIPGFLPEGLSQASQDLPFLRNTASIRQNV